MSFVLAMVLSVGFGSSLFAANYDSSGSYQAANSQSYSWTETTSSSTASGQGDTTTSEQTGQGFLIRFGSAQDRLSGNLSGVFSYYAGSMVGYQQAGGSFYLYDSYGMRGVLSNAGGKHFSLEAWNFRTSDLAKMNKLSTVADWESYLKNIGFSGESLRRMKFNEQNDPAGTVYTRMGVKNASDIEDIDKDEYNVDTNKYYYWTTTKGEGDEEETVYHRVEKNKAEERKSGESYAETWTDKSIGENGIEYQSMNIGLFRLLKETLQQGINFSASLSVGDGASGMSLTVSENGKQRATYVSYDKPKKTSHMTVSNPEAVSPFNNSYSDVRCTSEVLYNSRGMQYGTKSYTFEFDSTTANDKQNAVGVGGHWAASYTFINYDNLTGNRFDTTFNKVAIGDITDKDGNVVLTAGQFEWSNGDETGRNSTKTYSINNLGVRANTKLASSVLYYSSNGSRLKQVNNEKKETTYFADNQQSFTLNKEGTVIAKYQYTQNGVIEAAWQSNNTEDVKDGDKGGTYSVFDYWGRQVGSFNDTNGKNFGTHENAQAMLNIANTYKNNLIAGRNIGNVGGLQSVNWFEEDIKKFVNSSNRSDAINKIFDSKSITTMLNFSNGVASVATTSIADATWDENIPTDALDATTSATRTTDKKNETDKTKNVSTTLNHTKKTESGKGYVFSTTINAGGSAAFETKCSILTEKHTQITNYYDDPAVQGNIITDKAKLAEIFGVDPDSIEVKDGVVTIDGVSYVAVEAAEINMMDGSGFQAANGEVVVVQLNDTAKGNDLSDKQIKEIQKKVASGDTSVMFMGNVKSDVNGNMAIAVDTSYGGGVALEDIDTIKKEITLASLGAAIEQGVTTLEAYNATHGTEYTMEEVNKAKNDKDNEWAVNNTNSNIDKLKEAGFDFTRGDGIDKIKDAWQKLLRNPEEMQKYF